MSETKQEYDYIMEVVLADCLQICSEKENR